MRLPPSSLGCALDSLLRVLTGPWTIYILWRLHNNGPTRFGQLKRLMPGISSKMLTERLRTLAQAEIIDRHQEPTVPPQVTYTLTKEGRELTTVLAQLNTLADRWQDEDKHKKGRVKTQNRNGDLNSKKSRKGEVKRKLAQYS